MSSLLMELVTRGLYYKTLRVCNVRQMDTFCNKLVLYIVNHKHINFDKHSNLLQKLLNYKSVMFL
jgi:hypothetical protein